MLKKDCIARFSLYLILVGLVAVAPALAGSAVVGSVAGSTNATVSGQTLLPNTTLFSGDSVQVKDGVAVVALGGTSRMVFGRDTVASFLRDSNEVTVLLGSPQGSVSVFHDAAGTPVRVKIGDLSVVPVAGFRTLGEVAMLNGAVTVSAKDGALRVLEGNGQVVDVAKGKTITVDPQVRAPQGGGAGRCCGGSNIWGITATAAGVTAAILAGVALSRAGDAKTSADNAAAAASAAASAAAAAASAAEAAASASAANAAAQNAVGCALNVIYNSEGYPSPYTPPAGESCPSATLL